VIDGNNVTGVTHANNAMTALRLLDLNEWPLNVRDTGVYFD